MYIVYSPVKNVLGIWQDGWAYVAIERPVAVAKPGKQIAWIYLQEMVDHGPEWEVVAAL